jgi:hypothetical protein
LPQRKQKAAKKKCLLQKSKPMGFIPVGFFV